MIKDRDTQGRSEKDECANSGSTDQRAYWMGSGLDGGGGMVSIEELSKVELFEGLSPEQLTRISEVCEIVSLSKGEQLFREGEPAKNFFILLEGKVVIQIQASSSPANISVAVINQPNQSLGWSGLVSPYFYTASALCEQNCRLLSVEGAGFVEILKQDSEAGVLVFMRVAEVISNRLKNSRSVLLKAL